MSGAAWYAAGMDKSEVCQMALHELGEHEYVSGTPGFEACELYFRQVFMFLLKQHDWSFARKRVKLVHCEQGWKLPVDCLSIVELSGLRHWRKYGECIVPEVDGWCDGEVWAVYTSSECVARGYIPDDMADFAQAFIYHLAASICGCVSGDEAKRQELLERAEFVLREAMWLDAKQDASNDQHPLMSLMNNSVTA